MAREEEERAQQEREEEQDKKENDDSINFKNYPFSSAMPGRGSYLFPLFISLLLLFHFSSSSWDILTLCASDSSRRHLLLSFSFPSFLLFLVLSFKCI
ncbi:hypothetical protein EHP00_2517 [Ecytonucleospora hepatopenaei]|uniref:Uncharacterized protein n=1 Tax=Ecytonucleospora hepatopenaei TaxID=646526 RepID=A0A1W0E8R3_9MICR|nr:hypothetical protein EHP00_2517 [Ecytonucleospora hepatopenaei]